MIKFNENDKTLSNIAKIVEKRAKGEINLTIILDECLGEYNGKYEDGIITGGSYHSILELCGRFLRNPKMENIEFHSHKEACGVYVCSHNNNYYVHAPLDELYEYFDDLALWGMNIVEVWCCLYEYEDMNDKKDVTERLIAILKHCKSIGVKTAMNGLPNEAFRNSPMELRADWTSGHDGYIRNLNAHFHNEICPSVPGGMEKIIEYRRDFLEMFKEVELDYFFFLPYDQGGCSCSKCAPWGGNGYVKCCEALIPVIKEYYPNIKIVLASWQFGTFTGTDVEFEGLNKAIENGPLKGLVTYIQSEPQYQAYPFREGMARPIIAFPEISMCATLPWGGYGGNPIPRLLQLLWDKYGDKLAGGVPYSEGFFEDINKVIMFRFYRENQSASDTIKEYLAYEFGLSGEMLDLAHNAVMDMEDTFYRRFDRGHRYPLVKPPYVPDEYDVVGIPEKMPEIEKAIVKVHNSLPKEIQESKKWQLIYLRAVIDGELYKNDFTRNDKVLECFNKIIELYYLDKAGRCIRPDILAEDVYAKDLTPEEFQILAAGGSLS